MKKHLVFFVFALLMLGCTSGPQISTPTAIPSPAITPTPAPSPTPQTGYESGIQQAEKTVPVGGSFAELTGTKARVPEQYVLTTKSEFASSASLQTLASWNFEDDAFTAALRKVATARITTKTMSWQPRGDQADEFHITWQEGDTYSDIGAVVSVTLSKTRDSKVCAGTTGKPLDCFTPKKEQVDALWTALKSNALEEALQAVFPGIELKTILEVEKTEPSAFNGRVCDGYKIKPTQDGIDLLNELGGKTVADMTGTICIDRQYGFPLVINLKSALASVNERVVQFSNAKVGILQYPYSFRGLCTRPGGPCDTKKYTNPYIGFSEYPDGVDDILPTEQASVCRPAGHATLKIGQCMQYPSGDAFVLKSVGDGTLSLVKYDQNLKARGEYHIQPTGDIKKDQYYVGVNIDNQVLALAVGALGKEEADLDFIAYDQKYDYQREDEATDYVREYTSGFKDPEHPTASEAYYNIFSPGSNREEGRQAYRNSDHIYLKNGIKVAFYWFYPKPYDRQGRLDDKVTAYVWGPLGSGQYGSDLEAKTVVLELGKTLEVGPFEKKLSNYNQYANVTLELVKADLSRDGVIQVNVRSKPVKAPQSVQRFTDLYYDNYFIHRVFQPRFTGAGAPAWQVQESAFWVPEGDTRGTLFFDYGMAISDSGNVSFPNKNVWINGNPVFQDGPYSGDINAPKLKILQPNIVYSGPYLSSGAVDVTAFLKPGRNTIKYGSVGGSYVDLYKFWHKPFDKSLPDNFRLLENEYKCMNAVAMRFNTTLTQDTVCNLNQQYGGEMTLDLPSDAARVKYIAGNYAVNDGCAQVSINGQRIVNEACPVCPSAHENLLWSEVPISGKQVKLTAAWVDSQGGKGSYGYTMQVFGSVEYDSAQCLPQEQVIQRNRN